jgi:ferredoxin
MVYRLVIDPMKCESNGRCIEAAAGLIQSGADGSPVIVQTPVGITQDAAMRAAVAACPMGALRVEEVTDMPSG